MRQLYFGFAAVAALLAASTASAQVKVGMIVSYSGQFADTGNQLDNGFKLYMKQKGDTVAGKKVEVIRKDVGGIAPDVAKRLAQELIVRDKADILGGFELTPNALAVGDVSAEAKKFMVVMNAATSIITTKSPYMARTSVTTPMLNDALGTWAVKSGGIKKVYTLVSDFGPGHDAVAAFKEAFVAGGGQIVGAALFTAPVRLMLEDCRFRDLSQRKRLIVRTCALISLLLWVAVVVCGRWIAYIGGDL